MVINLVKVLGSLSMVLSLVSCASVPPSWHKQGVNPHDTNNAHAKCEYEVGVNKVEPNQQRKLIRACMRAQGFRWH